MKCVYIYNPTSGKQKNSKNTEYIVSQLQTKFDEVVVRPTQKMGDAYTFAEEACGVFDVLVVSGGDGTLNEIVNAIANKEQRPKIGYIPTGTTNDLAHSLRIPKNIKKAVNIILEGNEVKHDIFNVNDKYGIYVCAFGIFTASSYSAPQSKKRKFGKLAYYFSGIKELSTAKKVKVNLVSDKVNLEEEVILAIFAKGRYVSGYKINKNAATDDGNVKVILIKEKKKKGVSLKSLFNIFRAFIFGANAVRKSKSCVVLDLNEFSLSVEDDVCINLDGEKGFNGSFDFKVLNSHIDIFTKRKKIKTES